jgi:Sec-independent protein translocase protein TatA
MADIANGVKSFKKGVSDEEELKANNDSKTIEYIDTSKTKIHTEV